MKFKVKDLMTDVIPPGSLFAGMGRFVSVACDTFCCCSCSGESKCQDDNDWIKYVSHPDDLDILKENLKTALSKLKSGKQVNAERVLTPTPDEVKSLEQKLALTTWMKGEITDTSRPKTLGEVELLEQKLTGALKELHSRKEELHKKADRY